MLTNQALNSVSVSPELVNHSLTLYSSDEAKLHSEAVVLIHGWGCNSEIWQTLPEKLSAYIDVYTLDLPGFGNSISIDHYTEQSLVDWLDTQLPQTCYLIGLSLGGMLCRSFAAQYPERVLGLVTLSTNLKFVADSRYLSAMPSADFKQFSTIWDEDPSACLNRFSGLQVQGDQQQRQLTRQLRRINTDIDTVAGKDMLKLLAEIDSTQKIDQICCPSLAIFGGKDCLIPVNASNQLPDSHEVLVLDSAAHLPHLSCETQVLDRLRVFIDQSKYQLDKEQVAKSFGRAAETYDSAAHIQKWSSDQLLKSLDDTDVITSIVDLGCGTGTQTAVLNKKFVQAQVTGVDFSAPMLSYAKSQQADSGIKWLCCDAEDLALQDQSKDLVFSNFALQWCNDLTPSLAEIYRILDAEGQFYFAIPGPQTLYELRKVWGEVDDDIHINRFASAHQWQAALKSVGFSGIEITQTTKVEYHPSVKNLLWNLKTVGATNYNSGKSKQLTGKQHLKRLYQAYEQFKTSQDTYPATWDIIFGRAVK